MKFHPNYIKELKKHYKDYSYKNFLNNYKTSGLFYRDTSSWGIESLPDDAKWVTKGDMRAEKDAGAHNVFMDREGNKLLSEIINKEYGQKKEKEIMEQFEKRLKPKIKKFYENAKNELEDKFYEYEILNCPEDFGIWESPHIGKEYKASIARFTFNFNPTNDSGESLQTKDPELIKLLDYIKNIPNYEQLSKLKDSSSSMDESNDIKDYCLDNYLCYGDLQYDHIEYIIRDMHAYSLSYEFLELMMNNGDSIYCDFFMKDENEPSYLELEGYFDGRENIKHQGNPSITFLNPISGEWERVVLKYYGYDYGSFDYKRPDSELLNYEGFHNTVKNIKKYGKK